MRVLRVDFARRTDKDLVPLTPAVVLEGDLAELKVHERVLLKDDDLSVEAVVVLPRALNAFHARPDWNTVKFSR